MINKQSQRALSLVLAVLMVFSIIPVQSYATETPDVSQQIEERIQSILNQYGVTNESTDNDIVNAIVAVDGNTLKATMDEIDAIEEIALSNLNEEEFFAIDEETRVSYSHFCIVLNQLINPALVASSSFTALDGALTIADNQGRGSQSGSTYSFTANTDKGVTDGRKVNEITISYNVAAKSTLSFSYSVANGYDIFKVDGTDASASGTFTKKVSGSGSIIIQLKGKYSFFSAPAEPKLTLSGFSLVEVPPEAVVTLDYNTSLGSVTVDGAYAASGTTKTFAEGTSATYVATANNSTFLGWVDASTRKLLSQSGTYEITPAANLTIQPVFVNSASVAHFQIGTEYLFADLNAAINQTSNTNSKTIICANNGHLASGSYTIPSGVTLLIPYNSANTLITTNMADNLNKGDGTSANYALPSMDRMYRQLTMESGAKITIASGGAISIGSQAANLMIGQVGPFGAINMMEGSNITVQNGGNLYAWGYIFHGDDVGGTVTVENGGSVYEILTVVDYPGAAGITNDINSRGRFPLRSYTIRNVEVLTTYNYGGILNCFYSVYSGTLDQYLGNGNITGTFAFISSGSSVFQITEGGTITKSYRNGIQNFKLNGNNIFNNLAMRIEKFGQGIDINTSNTTGVPIPSGFCVEFMSGTTTVNENVLLHEGATVVIHDGATVELGDKNVYIFDADDDYGAVYQWVTDTNNGIWAPITDVHGTAYTNVQTDAVWDINGEVKFSGTGGIYTTTNKAAITSSKGTGKISMSETSFAEAKTSIDYKYDASAEVSAEITPAYLKNGDGTHTTFQVGKSNTYVYDKTHNRWAVTAHADTPITYHNDGDTHSATYNCCGATAISGEEHSYENYACTKCEAVQQFTIKFLNHDGTELLSTKVEYGTVPSYTGETPTKEATAAHTYSFGGWDKELAAVTGDATYTATFTEAVRTYSITWKNGDAILKTENLNYGATPSYSGETPTKDADAQYTYTFSSWSPEIVAVSADAVYTATFESNVRSYTVKFVNYNGDVLQTETLKYGETPVYKGENPTRDADAQYTYEFKSWDKDISAVKGDVTYTATYNTTTNKYVIKFVDENGTELQSSEVEFGVTPEFNGATPTKVGNAQYSYSFKGWTPEVVAVSGEATYTATYGETVNKYTIKFVNHDGTELQSGEVEYGTVPTYNGKTPTKEATAAHTYSFKSWDNELAAVTGDATYTATFTEAARTYTVTFVNEDGTQLQSGEVAYGETPEYNGATPTKAATAQYSYTFKAWDKELAAVSGDVVYTATYDATVNKYTITFVDEDGTQLQSAKVAYGEMPAYTGETPTKAATVQYSYSFEGWTPEVVAVTGEATYTATYTSEVNKYTVKYVNEDGTELKTETLEYGAKPTYDGTPVQKATAQYTFNFKAWDKAFAEVTGDATYTATYEAVVNKYLVKFVDENGTELQSSEVAYGDTPVYNGEAPTKAATAQYTYTFAGWTPEIAPVTGATTYTATYTETLNKYKVTWVIDGETVHTEDVEYGKAVTAPDKSKPGYTLTWNHAGTNITEDTTITGTYTANTYTVTWYKEYEDTYTTTQATFGAPLTLPVTPPTKEGYTFAGWFTALEGGNEVTAETIYEMAADGSYFAHWDVKVYEVNWVVENQIVETDEVEHGATPVYDGETPVKAADAQYTYTFKEWTPAVSAATKDVTYTAAFDKTVNSYTVKFQNEDGTELQSAEVAYGTTPAYTGATPTKAATAQYTYKFAGWTPEIVAVTGEAIYTATYTETVNKYTITWKNGETVLNSEKVAYGETPVYTGATPTKADDEQFTYTFSGWTPEIVAVTGEATYTATYTETLRKYTVKFQNYDGTVLQSSEVEYGTKPEYTGETPTKAEDEQFTYTFSGWTPELTEVTGEATYTANFDTKAFVAKIGDAKYVTLAEAIEVAPENSEIILLANVTESVTINKAVTIVKNGFTATVVAGEGLEVIEETVDRIVIREPDVDTKVLASYAKSLLFEDIIRIRYYFDYTGTEYSNEYLTKNGGILVWTTEQSNYDPSTADYRVEGLTIYTDKNGTHFYATGEGIPAKQWGDMNFACVYVKTRDGSYVYSDVSSYSPLTYATNMLGKTTTKATLKNLLISMLNYGTAAQNNFNYDTANPMNNALTDTQKAWAWDDSLIITKIEANESKFGFTRDEGIGYYAWSLIYEGAIGMRMYNSISSDLVANASEMGILYWTEDVYVNATNLTAENASGKVVGLTHYTGNYYHGTIEGTAAKNLGDTCFACAYVIDNEGTMHYGEVRSYSAHTYANNQIQNASKKEVLKNLCKTMVIYSDAAAKHFG